MKKFLLFTVLSVSLVACGNAEQEASLPKDEPFKSVEDESPETAESNEVEVSEEKNEEPASVDSEENTQEVNENGASEENPSEENPLKEQFLTELDAIVVELENQPQGETQIEMEELASLTYKVWDDALNKIFAALEEQLPTEQMDKLREEQRRWIKEKYRVASEEAAEHEGGTMESLVKINAQAEFTRERCYELVEKYMN